MHCNIQECLWQYMVVWGLSVRRNHLHFNHLHKPAFFAWWLWYILFQFLKMKREAKYFCLHVLSVCWCCVTMWKQKCCSRGTAIWKGRCSLSKVQNTLPASANDFFQIFVWMQKKQNTERKFLSLPAVVSWQTAFDLQHECLYVLKQYWPV